MTGLLVIMGSGETTPTMIKPHRAIFERVGDRPAVVLDTPYGFQSNADDISGRTTAYFADSVGREVDVLSWRRPPATELAREQALTSLRDAGWVFAGPGSPTYTLRQWADTPVPQLLADKLLRGGAVVFASAAALTLGSHTVPVYEIYKAGTDPHWVEGMDVVRKVTGRPAVVIPHYDNAEGGHHDTRYCYLGEGRLAAMEAELPADAFVLGVDEHTAVYLDLAAGTASVVGNGVLTIRRRGRSVLHPAGSVLELAKLGDVSVATGPGSVPRPTEAAPRDDGDGSGTRRPVTSIREEADRLDARFSDSLAERNVDGCVAALLELEQVLVDWAGDALTSDDGDHARGMLRGMVIRLGRLADSGARDPRDVLAPFVDALLEVRAGARNGKDFATSDRIRSRLAAAGVEVRDTPDGAEWELR
jgi:cyanophycinase-like exopeptidase